MTSPTSVDAAAPGACSPVASGSAAFTPSSEATTLMSPPAIVMSPRLEAFDGRRDVERPVAELQRLVAVHAVVARGEGQGTARDADDAVGPDAVVGRVDEQLAAADHHRDRAGDALGGGVAATVASCPPPATMLTVPSARIASVCAAIAVVPGGDVDGTAR